MTGRIHLTHCLLATLLIACASHASADNAPRSNTEAAAALAAELGLREASEPVPGSTSPGRKRVVVMMLSLLGMDTPAYTASLREAAAAGDIELVLDTSGKFLPGPELLKGADAIIGFCSPQSLAAAGPGLAWFHNYAAGMEHCITDKETTTVFSSNKRLSGPVIAEHTMAMLLALSRNLPAFSLAQDQGKWQRQLAQGIEFGELGGKTMLVVGLGGIGTEIARRANGLGMRVIATRNSSRSGPEFVDYVGLADELHKLAGQAHVVVNALPLTADTSGLFDRAFFEAMPAGGIFLSIGRGKSTVTDDLVAALQSGHLYGAGLDVTDPEPLPEGHALWQLPNVIITPHIAAAGPDNRQRTMIIAAENLRRYATGKPLLNVVNPARGY